jgi:hypothetical protein
MAGAIAGAIASIVGGIILLIMVAVNHKKDFIGKLRTMYWGIMGAVLLMGGIAGLAAALTEQKP